MKVLAMRAAEEVTDSAIDRASELLAVLRQAQRDVLDRADGMSPGLSRLPMYGHDILGSLTDLQEAIRELLPCLPE